MLGFIVNRKPLGQSCSFKTIPNGLRQHPISMAIIHSATINALRGILPDPSIKLWSYI